MENTIDKLRTVKLHRLKEKSEHYCKLKIECIKRQDYVNALFYRKVQYEADKIIKELKQKLNY